MATAIESSAEIDTAREIDLLISRSETADRGMANAIEREAPSQEPRHV